jgi:hypothetical protein
VGQAESIGRQQKEFDTYVKSVATGGGGGSAAEIEKGEVPAR